jgi:hypothetical protein
VALVLRDVLPWKDALGRELHDAGGGVSVTATEREPWDTWWGGTLWQTTESG